MSDNGMAAVFVSLEKDHGWERGASTGSSDSICFFHGREVWKPSSFKFCFECGHIWQTEDEFRRDLDALAEQMNNVPESWGKPDEPWVPPTDLSKVYSCPLCSHDF